MAKTLALNYRKRQYKGTLYPNGEFVYGWDSASYKQEMKESRLYEKRVSDSYLDICLRDEHERFLYYAENIHHAEARKYGILPDRLLARSLSLSYPSNTHSFSSPPKKTNGITAKAQRVIRNACYLMEKKYGKENLTFATFTIPNLPEQDRSYLMANWGEFKRRIIQTITRRLKSVNAPTEIIEVTEIQTERFKRTGALYLHSHCIWSNGNRGGAKLGSRTLCKRGGHRGQFAIDIKWLLRIFHRILSKFILRNHLLNAPNGTISAPEKIETPRIQVARINFSVASYLAKYLSKGAKELANLQNSCQVSVSELPRRWYYLGGGLGRSVRESLVAFTSKGADYLDFISKIPELAQEMMVWHKELYLELGDTTFRIGQAGRFTPQGMATFVEYLNQD